MHSQPSKTQKATRRAAHGFFIALTICLIAIGGVAAVTFSESMNAPPVVSDTPTTTQAHEAAQITAPPATTTTTRKTTTTRVTTTTAPTTAPTAASLYVLPLSNTVLTTYSDTPLYNDTLRSYRVHQAVDFDGEEGQRVRVLAAGTVTAIEEDALWGPCITVDHTSGIVSVYRGVVAQVAVGDELAVGDVLGTVAAIPCEKHLGPHLHMELYQNGAPVDVTTLLKTQLNIE